MKTITIRTTLLGSALILWVIPALAQAPAERLYDKDVKTLVDEVDEGRDKFEGNLDGDFKGSTVSGPSGQTKVAVALQTYQDSTRRLKDRFDADYSASAEVATVLKQSMAIHTFMQASPISMTGRAEWDHQTVNLKRLAEAYGTTFPFPDGATTRRTNDKEVVAIADAIADAADSFEDDLDNATTLSQADKDVAKRDVELLIEQSGVIKSRINDGEPARAEVQQLAEQAAKLETFLAAHSSSTLMNWRAVQTSLAQLQQAFGLTR